VRTNNRQRALPRRLGWSPTALRTLASTLVAALLLLPGAPALGHECLHDAAHNGIVSAAHTACDCCGSQIEDAATAAGMSDHCKRQQKASQESSHHDDCSCSLSQAPPEGTATPITWSPPHQPSTPILFASLLPLPSQAALPVSLSVLRPPQNSANLQQRLCRWLA
jgi:hypothetical protein